MPTGETAALGVGDTAEKTGDTVAPTGETATPTGTPPTTVFTVDGLAVAANPNSVLSCILTWTTPQPATSEVRVPDHSTPFGISGDSLVLEHRVVLVGLHAETAYTLQVESVDGGGNTDTAEISWTTGTLPPEVPRAEVLAHAAKRMEPGWTLLNLSDRLAEHAPVAVLYDADGEPVWYRIHGSVTDTRGDVVVSLTHDKTVLVGPSGADIAPGEYDLEGTLLWTGPLEIDGFYHHELRKLADGTFLGLRTDPGEHARMDTVLIYDAAHTNVWSLDLRDFLAVPDGAGHDFTHCNSASLGLDPDHLLVSCRNLNSIFALSRSKKQIVWTLGSRGDFAADPVAIAPFTEKQHAPEQLENGHILVYDNAGLPSHARVVEFALDEASKTSTLVWEFPGDFDVDPWYRKRWKTPFWGDADRLPNGNTLVTAGTRQDGHQSRVFEVTSEGAVVWELLFPSSPDSITGIYRADRVVPPWIEAL